MDRIIYNTHSWLEAQSLRGSPKLRDALSQRIAQTNLTVARQGQQKKNPKTLRKISRTFLDYATLPEYEYAPLHIIFKRMGNLSSATQSSILKELQKIKFLELAQFRASRHNVRVKQLTEKGLDFLHKDPPTEPGKGGIVHSHISHCVRDVGLKRHYEESVLEWLVEGTSHSCDVGFKINGKWVAVEAVVDCFSNISHHLRACFIESEIVESLIIVTTQKSLWPKIESKIVSDPDLVFFLNRIKFEVVETYMKELWS